MTMEPNNIENQFREKLNSREINPSENSWDRLDAMLTVAEEPKRNFRWMHFAASFLGFIWIATVFLNQTEEVIDVPSQKVAIEQNEVENNNNNQNNSQLEKIIESTPTNHPDHAVATSEKAVTKQNTKTILKQNNQIRIKDKSPTETAIASSQTSNSSTIINQKTNINVDADALLASVDTPKSAPATLKNAVAVTVNSNELLSQVDQELDLSFRERVLKSVNKKYREVKVAVVNRNIQ
jgi:hypothetical protein